MNARPRLSTCSTAGLPRVRTFADDDAIRSGAQARGVVAFPDRDSGRAEDLAHRRVGPLVAAAYSMPERMRKERQSPHEGAADPEEVEVQAGAALRSSCGPRATRPGSGTRRGTWTIAITTAPRNEVDSA